MKNFKTKKALFSLVLLSMLIQMFVVSPFTNVKADSSDQILDSLIIKGKENLYVPGEEIYIEALWSLPDDTVEKQWKAGDQFSISIPDGLQAGGRLSLGGFGTGEIVGDKIVFTFNEQIEGLVDRKGGFDILYVVGDPGTEGVQDLPLEFIDENNNVILKDVITVEKPEYVEGESNEIFSKAKMAQNSDGLRWFIRVNRSGELSGDSVVLYDKLGPDQILDVDSFSVMQSDSSNSAIGSIDYKEHLVISEDKKSFSINLDISQGQWYDIQYNSIYTGDYNVGGKIELENSATLKSKELGSVPMDSQPGNPMVKGEFNLGAWAEGRDLSVQRGTFALEKKDSASGKGLEGVRFKFTHLAYPGESFELITDKDGKASKDQAMVGVYAVSEVETPAGYIPLEDQEVFVQFENNSIFEYEVFNDPIIEYIEVKGQKQWFDADGKEIESQDSIVLKLLQEGEAIRTLVLPKGEKDFVFKNLPKHDKNGKEIKYTVNELEMDGYEKTELINKDGEVVVINKLKPVEPETPEPEEPVTYINITGEKQWFDAEGKEIESQESIEIELLQDGKVIEKQVLPKGEYKFSFNDLLEFDEDGNRIEYTINEVSIDGYKKAEILKQEDNTVLIVNQQDELPEEPVTPEPVEPTEPEKPVTPEPVEPTEPEKPVTPEPVEPEEPGELLPPASLEPIIEEGVLSVNKNPGSRPSDKEVLPQTGMSANYLGYVISAAGLALTVLAKKKD